MVLKRPKPDFRNHEEKEALVHTPASQNSESYTLGTAGNQSKLSLIEIAT